MKLLLAVWIISVPILPCALAISSIGGRLFPLSAMLLVVLGPVCDLSVRRLALVLLAVFRLVSIGLHVCVSIHTSQSPSILGVRLCFWRLKWVRGRPSDHRQSCYAICAPQVPWETELAVVRFHFGAYAWILSPEVWCSTAVAFALPCPWA